MEAARPDQPAKMDAAERSQLDEVVADPCEAVEITPADALGANRTCTGAYEPEPDEEECTISDGHEEVVQHALKDIRKRAI